MFNYRANVLELLNARLKTISLYFNLGHNLRKVVYLLLTYSLHTDSDIQKYVQIL